MKKVVKGFTLIELMIVVAIIGILAAIAIPNFLKYQLRAKFGEMPTAINAWFKAEESLRQSERTIPGHTVTGQYFQTGALPATCTPGPTKNAWINTDVATANSIDWVVEGSTYGCYDSLVGAVNAADNLFGGSISMWSVSDIDGDAVNACVALFKPVIGANGDPTATGAAPDTAAACGINAAVPWSQIHRAPDDNTF